MEIPKSFKPSSCKRCRYYKHQGRRGGQCLQFNVPVQGNWPTCSLANPIFAAAA